jgi:hypothetical protein
MTIISKEYLELQQKLHENKNYGTASIKQAPLVKQIFEKNNFMSISDYGAGKKNLQKALFNIGLKDFKYLPFDPAFPEYGNPEPADLVCCIDVLEHIEPEYLDNVMADLKNIIINAGFFTIATIPARKTLVDGRNAHLIIKPTNWWLSLFLPIFYIEHLQQTETGFLILVRSNSLSR